MSKSYVKISIPPKTIWRRVDLNILNHTNAHYFSDKDFLYNLSTDKQIISIYVFHGTYICSDGYLYVWRENSILPFVINGKLQCWHP
jgi:hypothetical protein